MLGEHAAHDIFVDLDAEGVRNLLRDFRTTKPRIALLDLNDRGNRFSWRSSKAIRESTRHLVMARLHLISLDAGALDHFFHPGSLGSYRGRKFIRRTAYDFSSYTK